MKKRMCYLILPIITLILECLPYGAVCVFDASPAEYVRGTAGTAIRARNVLAVAVLLSLGPPVFGVHYFSLVGGLITLSLAAELLLLHFAVKGKS